MTRSRDDLPAFGRPTSPTSERTLSSSKTSRSSPGSPRSLKAGACRVEVAKEPFPRPPSPPPATTKEAPGSERSASRPFSSKTWVPTGTSRCVSPPRSPARLLPEPCLPRSAFMTWRRAYGSRVVRSSVAWRITDPPSPPRPPSGPPRGLYFSRLKETLPSPPRPARTTKLASSTNCKGAKDPRKGRWSGRGLLENRLLDHAHHALAPGAVEVDPARDPGEEGVVGAFAHVLPRVHLRAALAHDDAPCGDHLAPVCLYSESPARRVAAVTRGASALLMSHQIPPVPSPGSTPACARSSSCSPSSACTCRRGSCLPADGPGSRPWPSSRRGRTPLRRPRSRQGAPRNPRRRPPGGRRPAPGPLLPCTAFHRSLQPQTSRAPRIYQATTGVHNVPHGATVYPPCSASTTR